MARGLAIGEYHGKASWAVKSIWREYSGWLHYEEGTTALYGVPRTSVDADLVELAGGADILAARAGEARRRGSVGSHTPHGHRLECRARQRPLARRAQGGA
ncbi:alkyl sulfatase dimerization domain-containing protein [Novosphingobium panipatense]